MKYCEKYASALSALIDGELSDAERAEILAHLEVCESCRAFLAELTAMRDAMGELEEYDAPAGFTEGVMARIHEAAPKKRAPRAAWLSLAACAAIVVLAVGGPLRGVGSAAPKAAPEAAMLTMAQMADRVEESCAEEEYTEEFTSVQSAPRTMMAMSDAAPAEGGQTREATGDAKMKNSVDEAAELAVNNASFANEAELPRSVVFVCGAAREDYLIEEAVRFDYCADGSVAGYDLPTEKLDEFLALLDADGVQYDSAAVGQAATFYVQYEEGNENE